MATNTKSPSSILIVGSGVFGLSTALALSARPGFAQMRITLLEGSATFPNPVGSSVDNSRIVRSDYANAAYARLGVEAQKLWRHTEWGAEGRYSETGYMLVAPKGKGEYLRRSLVNVQELTEKSGQQDKIQVLNSRKDIEDVLGVPGGGSGDWGYVNWLSGWSNAEASVKYAMDKLLEQRRVEVLSAMVKKLLRRTDMDGKQQVIGVELADGSKMEADLVVLATGAWTGSLVDLRGRAEATGQVLAYIDLTEEEVHALEGKPTIHNFDAGMFIITPKTRVLKIARHGYGYRNPQQLPNPDKDDGEIIEVSLPRTDTGIPPEGQRYCRQALKEMYPALGHKPFVRTRICWYTDTPTGDFIVDYHPSFDGLFLATGGSGHAYKFFPVLGEKVVDALEGQLDPELRQLWAWPDAYPGFTGTDDGSRGGARGMILKDELEKSSSEDRESKL